MPKNNLYVKNLGNLDDDDLWVLFNGFGKIISHKISRNSSGDSKGFGFVCFQHEKDAETAINQMNGSMIGSKPLYVSYFQGKDERKNKHSNEDNVLQNKTTSNKLAVSNLDENIDNEKLRYLFARFGNITSSNVKKLENGKGIGFGVVTFEKTEDAQVALNVMNGFKLHSKKLCVKPMESMMENTMKTQMENTKMKNPMNTKEKVSVLNSRIKSVPSSSSLQAQPCLNKIFVGNLDERISSHELRALFTEYGTITSCCVLEKNGKSRGCGIVGFTSEEEARNSILFMNGLTLYSKQLNVDFYKAKAEQKNDTSEKNQYGSQLNLESRSYSISETQSCSKIYVKNLHEDVDDSALNYLFARFGSITSFYVLRAKNGRSKGSGVVHFSCEEEALNAIRKMDGTMFMSKELCVEFFQLKFKNKNNSTPDLRIKVDLMTPCSTFGCAKFTYLPSSKCQSCQEKENQSDSFNLNCLKNDCNFYGNPEYNGLCSRCFMKMTISEAMASSSAKSVSSLDLSTRSAKRQATKYNPKNDFKKCNLRIENLDDDVDDDGLHRLFSHFGKIVSAKLMTYNNGASKGYGFVCYETNEEASKAISSMNGVTLFSKKKLVVTYYEQQQKVKNVDGNDKEVEKECCICYNALTTRIVFDPCGHSCVCDVCVTELNEKCPICREKIIKYIKAYI